MEVYLVGGAVRDELLGLPVAERDWVVVGATPQELLDRGYRRVGRNFPVFLHPESREEYALARTERKVGPGHQGFVCHTGPDVTLEQDLKRRDLTVNAIARNAAGQLIDPWHGQADLENRCLRHVSDAFAEDPLRVFRVARFAAKLAPFHFRVSAATLELMSQLSLSDELAQLSPERVWQELLKALKTPAPWRFVQVLEKCAGLAPWFSELHPQAAELAALWHSRDWQSAGASQLQRYAAIGWLLDSASMESLSRRLKVPNEFRQMAGRVASYGHDVANWKNLAPETLLACISGLGGLRKQQQQRFETLLEVIARCSGSRFDALQDLAGRLAAIGRKSLTRSRSGPALGAAIERLRLRTIAQARPSDL